VSIEEIRGFRAIYIVLSSPAIEEVVGRFPISE